jgi:hypothetical protein
MGKWKQRRDANRARDEALRALAQNPLAGMTKLQAFAAAKEAGLVDGLPQDRWAAVFNAFFDGYVVNVMKALALPQAARNPEAWVKLASVLVDDYKKGTPIGRIVASGEILQKDRGGPIDRASQLLGQQPLPGKSSSNNERGPVDDAEQSTASTPAAEVEPRRAEAFAGLEETLSGLQSPEYEPAAVWFADVHRIWTANYCIMEEVDQGVSLVEMLDRKKGTLVPVPEAMSRLIVWARDGDTRDDVLRRFMHVGRFHDLADDEQGVVARTQPRPETLDRDRTILGFSIAELAAVADECPL